MTQWTSQESDVQAALARLRAAEQGVRPSAATTARVMAAWDAAHAATPVTVARTVGWWMLPLAATVCAAMVGPLLGERAAQAPAAVVRDVVADDPSAAVLATMLGQARVVRLAVPADALPSWGLAPIDAAPTVVLDVYVGDDGVARAARLADATTWDGGW